MPFPSPGKFPDRGKLLTAFLTGLICTVALTWPYAAHLSAFYPDHGDFPWNGWILWYNHLAVTKGFIFNPTRYFDSIVRYPMPYALCYSEHMFVPSLIFFPIYALSGNLPLSVNLFVFSTFILNYMAAFIAAYFFTESAPAATVAAIVYAFNPLAFSAFPHLFQLSNRYFLPFVFLYAYLYFESPSPINAFLFFMFFTLNGLSVIYFEVFTLALLPVFLLPYLFHHLRKKDFVYFVRLVKPAWTAIPFIPALLYFNLPYLAFSAKEGVVRTIGEWAVQSSARWVDWFSPAPNNIPYFQLFRLVNPMRSVGNPAPGYFDHTVFLGILPVILAAIGIIYLVGRGGLASRSYLLVMAAAFILSFGPYYLGWNGVYRPGQSYFRLPYYYLYSLTPLLNGIRTPTRFQFVFYVPFSLFCAYGFEFIRRRRNELARLALILIPLLLAAENLCVWNYNDTSYFLTGYAGNGYLKDRNYFVGKVTLDLPYYTRDFETRYYTWQTLTGAVTMDCFGGSYVPEDVLSLLTPNAVIPSPESLRAFKAIGIDDIVIHKDLIRRDFPGADLSAAEKWSGIKSFEDRDLLILDLNRLPRVPECEPEKNFTLALETPPAASRSNPVSFRVFLKNEADCYLASRYGDRYVKASVIIGKSSYVTYLKLPVVMEPRAGAVLTDEIKPGLFSPLPPPGNYRVTVKIPRFDSAGETELQIRN